MSLRDAMEKAKEQELLMELLEKRVKGTSKFMQHTTNPLRVTTEGGHAKAWQTTTSYSNPNSPARESSKSVTVPTNITRLPDVKKITPAEMARRREKGLCYNCDEFYVHGHKCQKLQLFLMVGDEEKTWEMENELCDEIDKEVELIQSDFDEGGISIHTLKGTHGIHTLQIEGMIKGQRITMLVNTGSTHNFISQTLVKSQKLSTIDCAQMNISLADGSSTACNKKVEGLVWRMGHTYFISDFHAISIGG